MGLFDFLRYKKDYDVFLVSVIRRIKNEDLDGFLQIRNEPVGRKGFDLIEYVRKKVNENIFIIGGARSGKTTLGEYLCLKLPERKIIISFKKFLLTKRDFEIGYHWIDVTQHLPNLFSDWESFIEAFRTAFFADLSMKGLMIDVILDRVAYVMFQHPKNFEEFFKILDSQHGGQWEENIKSIIKSKVQLLQRATTGARQGNIDFSKGNIILDLGNVPDTESKTFLAEYYLRQINRIEQKEQREERIRVVIDEAWHLLRYKQQSSIVGTILLEGAYYLRFLCITQNYTHLDEDYRSHFGTIFCFRNTNDKDMQAIEKGYGAFVRDGVIRLRDYEFIDIKYEHDEDVIAVFKLNYERLQTLKLEVKEEARLNSDLAISEYFTGEQQVGTTTQTVQVQAVNDDDKTIIKNLEKNEFCMTAHGIALSLGYGKNHPKRGNIISRTLKDLEAEGKIRKIDYITITLKPEQKPRQYYYSIPNGESQVHRTIIEDAGKVLDKLKIKYTESQVNQGWDIYAPDFCIDAKTGFQEDVKDDVRKLLEKSAQKVIFVCANYKVKKRYENAFSAVDGIEGKFRVCCLNELEEVLKDWTK
ncbi:MAG: hypothetical protein KGI28_00395 [Thaumarchaeota archaeon]|nr:hypothetical protein [Nitrososphaerota archaeon]